MRLFFLCCLIALSPGFSLAADDLDRARDACQAEGGASRPAGLAR